ncbi:RimK/LysX family protein, partial [Vibrio genomosp. F10]
MPKTKKIVIGRLESIALPDLSIENMHVRVDTGAKTSSLHVDNIVKIKKNGKPHVSFDIHPDVHNVDTVVS